MSDKLPDCDHDDCGVQPVNHQQTRQTPSEVPEVQNGRDDLSDIEPYQYGSMKAKPYNW